MKSAFAVFLLLVFRAWLLEPVAFGLGANVDQFYAVYDAIPALIGVFALKCVSPKLHTAWRQIGLDLMLAVLWADLIDRCMGIATFETHDWLLLPFLILAVMKHTILKPYLK